MRSYCLPTTCRLHHKSGEIRLTTFYFDPNVHILIPGCAIYNFESVAVFQIKQFSTRTRLVEVIFDASTIGYNLERLRSADRDFRFCVRGCIRLLTLFPTIMSQDVKPRPSRTSSLFPIRSILQRPKNSNTAIVRNVEGWFHNTSYTRYPYHLNQLQK